MDYTKYKIYALKRNLTESIYDFTSISPDKLSPETFRNYVLEEIKHKVEREVNR